MQRCKLIRVPFVSVFVQNSAGGNKHAINNLNTKKNEIEMYDLYSCVENLKILNKKMTRMKIDIL